MFSKRKLLRFSSSDTISVVEQQSRSLKVSFRPTNHVCQKILDIILP